MSGMRYRDFARGALERACHPPRVVPDHQPLAELDRLGLEFPPWPGGAPYYVAHRRIDAHDVELQSPVPAIVAVAATAIAAAALALAWWIS